MRVSTIVSLLAVGAGNAIAQSFPETGKLGNATAVTGNPIGKEATANLPEKPWTPASSLEGNVKGYLTAKTGPGGKGVEYHIKISNLPKEGGPFLYHVHDKKVPENGNCTATAAHLDPFLRGEATDCSPSYPPETCQVGDNSGKYGKITSDPFEATYVDPFGSMVDGSNASIHDRSWVLHFANKTRITCANFVVSNSTGYPTYLSPSGTTSGRPYPTNSVVPAAANALSSPAMLTTLGAMSVAALLFVL